MKKAFLFLIIFLFSSLSALAVETVITKDKSFRIDFVRVDPSPLEPGRSATLFFEMTNLGEAVSDLSISLVQQFPFSDSQEAVFFKEIKKGERVSFSYNIEVSPDIKEGTYQIGLQYFSEKISSTISEAFKVNVKSASSVLKTTSFSTSPEKLEPGKQAQLKLTLLNTANSKIKDITAKLTLENASIPLAPLNAGAERKIKELAVNQQEEVSIDVIVLPDAEVGVYKIPLKIEYFDELSNKIQINDVVSVIIDAPVELRVLLEDENTVQLKEKSSVTISVSNIGINDVKFLTVTLKEREGYKVISKDVAYIGNLESDDFDSVDFTIFPEEKVPLSLLLEYKDTFNKDYQQELELELPIYSKSDARTYGIQEKSSVPAVLLTVVLLAVVISFVRKWIKKKSFTKALLLQIASILLGIVEFFRLLRPVHLKNKLKEIMKEKDD